MSDNYRRLNSLLAPAVRPTGRQEVQQAGARPDHHGRHTELHPQRQQQPHQHCRQTQESRRSNLKDEFDFLI